MKTQIRIAGLIVMLVNVTGCANLVPTQESITAATVTAEVPESRSNLLHSLRHNASYGLIPYGSKTVLYRDLTKPHPSRRTATVDHNESQAVAHAFQVGTYHKEVTSVFGRGGYTRKNEAVGIEKSISQSGSEVVAAADSEPVTRVVKDVRSIDSQSSEDEGCHGREGYVRKADENWLAERDSERWTIQIISAADASKPCIDDELLDVLHAPDARRFSVYYGKGIWNIAVIGDYSTADEAIEAAKDFEAPWVRKIGVLRGRRCSSVAFMPDELRETLSQWCVTDSEISETALATADTDNSAAHAANRLPSF